MGFLRITFYILLAVSVYYTANNFQGVTTNVTRAVTSIFPKVLNVMSVVVTRVHDYYTQDMTKDASKVTLFISNTSKTIWQILTPLVKRFGHRIVETVVAVHDNAMSYTEDGLNQILGIEGIGIMVK